MNDIVAIANRYHLDVHAIDAAAVPGEPEAQLTTPVSNLLCALVEHAGLGVLRLIRESRLGGTRPDFAAMHVHAGRAHQIGYIELKASGMAWSPAHGPTNCWISCEMLTVTLDKQPAQADLLERICAGPLITSDELPRPTTAQRKPPK